MSEPNTFSERGQEPYHDIPTEPDAFLEWASRQPREAGRFELSNGVVIRTVINVTKRHVVVCSNISFELMRQLDRNRYVVAVADFAVRTGNSVRGPDVVVDEAGLSGPELWASRPIFIAEVQSPSTAVLDATTKQREYAAIPSLQTYVICSQDEPRAWVWARKEDGTWPIDAQMIEGREAKIPLNGLDIALSMAAIFRGIPDAPTL